MLWKKRIALVLCLLFLQVNLPPLGREDSYNKLDAAFQWAKKSYIEGKYRECSQKLDLLLTFLEPGHKTLRVQVLLLLGAANEKMGQILEARGNYKAAKELAGEGIITIADVDVGELVEFQRVIMGNIQPLMERVIEREARRPKRKKTSVLMFIAGLTVVAGLVAFIMLKKETQPGVQYVSDLSYDTRHLGIIWIEIPMSGFPMGDNFNEGEADEQPVHPVTLGQYKISKYEITYSQYAQYCIDTGTTLPPQEFGVGDHPVINVSWQDAQDFCIWLSSKTGKTIMLPTEAQWERAARGDDQRRYPWGNGEPKQDFANYNSQRTEPVGSFPTDTSPDGLQDMAGNVAEWCLDGYDAKFYKFSSQYDPFHSRASHEPAVVRGGSWTSGPDGLRAADRHTGNASTSSVSLLYKDVGFRIVQEL